MTDDALRRLPKADLHCHLDGSLRPATVLELAREAKVKLPADNVKDLLPFIQVGPSCRSLAEFLDVFALIYPVLRSPRAVERAAYELVEDCARENIRHVEVRFAPVLQETKSFSTDEVVAAALRGLKRGGSDFKTTSSVIVCLIRSHSPGENRRAFDTLKKAFNPSPKPEEPAVVALDIAGDEAAHPTMEFAPFYEEAKSLGMWTTCHAGETAGTENLKAALELGVGRIGHGTHLLENPKLLAKAARRKVPLEIGLTSNVRTRSVADLNSHPLREFLAAGVPVTLNTDDRGIIGIDLTHEYRQAQSLGFSVAELARLSLESVDHLFLPAPERARLRARFDAEIANVLGSPTA